MNQQEAKNLIRDTFQNPFDEQRFRLFAKNLFNDLDESKAFSYQGQYIPDAYKGHVRQYKRLGKYTDPEGAALDVLVVNLKREAALDRARTMQRNFIAWYLKHRGEKEAAIVAYHTEGLDDWRFSYVRMDYRAEQDESGKVRVKTDLTPARRYSFLVGKNEPNHTAQQQLLSIVQDDRNNPTLAELEKAFNIESVTREFFERYKNLFLKVKEELDELVEKDRKIREDFTAKGINTADFAKKLLGQIVFLYFLQKKGWLGVEKNISGNFKGWGTGPKDFLQRLHRKEIVPYDNFFNDLLEPLFYEALAIDRGEESYYSPFKCKIPFLNGGLFEPISAYNWQETDILIRNETIGEVFATFDQYNFTVREDEPLEKEVAVDPEMLGKVFENLLEVKDRKSKGAYYTPREIVHYMCQQSLINYLEATLNGSIGYERLGTPQTELFAPQELAKPNSQMELMAKAGPSPIPREEVVVFIRQGEFGIENDMAKEQGTKSYSWKLPESIRTNAQRIDEALADIKICDPAIGSGAFPVGMLHEIVRARETLTVYLSSPTLAKGGEGGFDSERTTYNFKRHAIQQSIYGVDIDCGAVDIAKLRLWLSLVVDEDDFQTIKPLPNLDYKIVCGNSLLSVERNVLNYHLFAELESLKQRFFDEINPRQKKDEKSRIGDLIRQLTNNDEHFDYEIYFSEIFHKKRGFDVVIANPPYVRHEAIKEFKPELKKTFGAFYCGTADLYTYFYKRGLEILKPGGHLCFIAPNKFMRAGYGNNTRVLLTSEATPKIVIDFGDLPIFDATTYPSILLVQNVGADCVRPPFGGNGNKGACNAPLRDKTFLTATFTDVAQLERLEETLATAGFSMPVAALKTEGWTLERPEVLALMEKLRKAGTPLGEYVKGRFYRGVLTGLNEAFVIDEATRKQLIAEDPKSAELIKPWLRGRDIRKWKAEWAGLYVIFTRRGTDIEKYPAIKRYLEQFREDLEPKKTGNEEHGRKPGPYKWFDIQDNIAYFEEFEKEKIVYQEIATFQSFGYANPGCFCNNKCFLIPRKDDYLLSLFNSKLFWWFLGHLTSGLVGGARAMQMPYMEQLPIFPTTDTQKAPIIERVQKILANPDSPAVPQLEAEIDRLVYELYGLSGEEIALVEGKK
jgi:type I restriction-modification system DNA methylase subunit